MSENEKDRWKVEAKRSHPSILKMFGLVAMYTVGTTFIGIVLFILVSHSCSNNWAQWWLWFTAAMFGSISVDVYAVKCLSGEDGDIIYSYLRGFFRSTSKVNEEGIEIEIESTDEDNQVEELEEVVASPVHSNENNNTNTNTNNIINNNNNTSAPTDQVIELTTTL